MSSKFRTRTALLSLGLCALSFSFACEDKDKLAAIQQQADQRVAEAEKKAQSEVSKLRAEIDALKQQYEQAAVQAKQAADSAIAEAKSDAEQSAVEAEKAWRRARDAYKAEARAKLNALNEDARELKSSIAKVPAKSKPVVQKAFKEVEALQKDVGKDIAAFDKATLETLKATKNTLNNDLAKLKARINSTKAKLPKA